MATPADQDEVILSYLARKGHSRAEAALRLDLQAASPSSSTKGQVSLDDFAARNAPNRPAAANGGARKPAGGAALLADPPSWEKGYEGLRAFVENSLDIHRPELHPLLLPLFVHSYLDLVLSGYRDAADHYLARFAPDHDTTSAALLRLLSSLRLPTHVTESDEATRWRTERYHVKLSERGWGLLLGWLQGGGLAGSIEGSEGRGRDRVLAIINERVKVDAVPGPPAKSAKDFGLASDFTGGNPGLAGLDELKLGAPHMDVKLSKEVNRRLTDEDERAGIVAPVVVAEEEVVEGSGLPALISPFPAELPPYPVTLRTIDVAREVEKVREARKRIKLDPSAFVDTGATDPLETAGAAKPSVCLFTLHDAGESLTTVTFSEDSTLMATGFSESYIRLWNLKGENLVRMRNDFNSDDITDAASLKALKLKTGSPSLKLIGHSAPVHALSFDPIPGPSAPPRYLLSSSTDTTIRLWSLETYTNLVVYRGHREPVWDVEWGPKGVYFASASRDRTARLWSTDRIAAVRIFVGHLSDVNCVKFHPNSLYLATGSSDRTCRLWDVQKGMCVRVFVGHCGSVTCLAISPDGRYLASGSDDLTIGLWDLASGQLVKSLLGHTAPIRSLSFSAESTVLISGASDATVRVWDVHKLPTGELVKYGGAAGEKKDKKIKMGGGGGKSDKEVEASDDLLTTLTTKRTPVLAVHFTPRNLCLAAGPMEAA